jgi:hypothetical protein
VPKPSLIVVILEDDRQRGLVYRYLRRRGLSPHEIRTKLSPAGRGSAEHWVRKMYATEVKAYRLRRAKASTALIVMIDADLHTVQARMTQLSNALGENGVQGVGDAEEIARLVPKRNVEAWILCLTEQPVDEDDDYKHARYDWNELTPRASENLFRWTRSNAVLPKFCIGSLRRGVTELNRLAF